MSKYHTYSAFSIEEFSHKGLITGEVRPPTPPPAFMRPYPYTFFVYVDNPMLKELVMNHQRRRHISDDGSVFEALKDGRLVPVSVEEGQSTREKLEEVERDAVLRRWRELEELRRRGGLS